MPSKARTTKHDKIPGKVGRQARRTIKKKGLNFERYIYQTMKALGIQKKIKKSTMEIMNSFTVDLFKKIARGAGDLCTHSTGKVLGAAALEGGVKLCFPSEMARLAIQRAEDVCKSYRTYKGPQDSKVIEILDK